jgi:hypothetical protein
MRSKLAISVLTVAALCGATPLASAQTLSAPTAATGSDTTKSNIKSNKQPGVTTGFASRPHTAKGVLPNPTTQSARDDGTGRGK